MLANTIQIKDPALRVTPVRNLVRPLRPRSGHGPREVRAQLTRRDRMEVVVSAVDTPVGDSYRDWFFGTNKATVLAQYFEEWVYGPSAAWQLNQACLHLFWVDRPRATPAEILGLHCEPREAGETRESVYKRGPHIHVTADGNRLKGMHIPLELGLLEQVMESCDTLTPSLERAIEIIRYEIIDRD